jgi:CelD/BcsL family acetyltransferase involved in cellulose biosynthesis
MKDIRLQLARGTEGLDDLAGDWSRLAEQVPDLSYLQLWAWHRSYLEALAPEPERAITCALYHGRSLVAILPLRQSGRRVAGIPLAALELPTHEHMQHTDLLVHPDWQGRLHLPTLMATLAAEGLSFDALVLGPVLADSTATAVCRAGKPLLAAVELAGRSDALATGPYEQLLDGLSKNFRGNLRKARNKVESRTDVRMVSASTPAELRPALEHFLAVEASGWKGETGTGTAIANDPRLLRFYGQLVERLGREGRLEIHLMFVGDRAIAAQLALLAGRRCYLLKIGYDESFAQLAPGNMLLERLLRRYEGHPQISHVDLVSGAPWHDSWKPQSRATQLHYLFRPSTKGLLAWAALQGRQALRPMRRQVMSRWNELVAARSPERR